MLLRQYIRNNIQSGGPGCRIHGIGCTSIQALHAPAMDFQGEYKLANYRYCGVHVMGSPGVCGR